MTKSFLEWNNQKDAQDSLDAINQAYGCPFVGDNGYIMERWDLVTESETKGKWGWNSAEARLGKTKEQLAVHLKSGYTEHDKRPDDWKTFEMDNK